MPETQDYLDAIGKIKAASGTLPPLDVTKLPPNVDTRQIIGSYIEGLPEGHANFVNASAMGGKPIPPLNLSKVPGYTPPRQGSDLMQGSIYQDYPKTRFLSEKIVRPVAEMAGQFLGGAVGAAAGTPEAPGVGTAILGATGATLGGTAADELMNKADEAVGLRHPENSLPGRNLIRVRNEALTNAAMVGGGKILGKVGGELAAPFSNEVNVPVQAAAKELNVPLTAAQQSNSKLLSQGEQMAAKLPGSAGIMGDFYAKTRARMMDIANSLFGKQMNPQIAKTVGDGINQQLLQKTNELAQAGITPQYDPALVGNSIAEDISNFTKGEMAKSQATFNSLKGNVPRGTTVPLSNTASQAIKLLAEHQGLPPSLQDKKLVSVLQDLQPQMADTGDISSLMQNASPKALELMKSSGLTPQAQVPEKSVQELMGLRSAIGDAAAQHEAAFGTNRPGTKFMGSPVSGAYKSLIGNIDKDLGQVGGNFSKQYAQARANHGAMISTMENPYLKRILSTDQPEKIVEMAVRPGDVSNLASLQKMLNPATAEQLGQGFTNSLIEKSQNMDGQFIPQKLAQLIKQYGEPTITQAVGPDGLNNLKKLTALSDGSFGDPEFRNFIGQMGKKNGENVTGFLMGASPQNINRVRALIGENSFKEAQDGMIHNLLTNNQDNIDFGGLAKRMSDISPDSLATAIPPEKLAILNKLSTIGGGIKASQREFSNPSGTAPMMGMFYIFRQLFSNPLNALKVIGGLEGATKVYTTPLATKYLTQGFGSKGVETAAKLPISIFGNSLSNPYKKAKK